MQIAHKVLYWKGNCSLNAIGIPIWRMSTLTRLYELRSPALTVSSTDSNICMHNPLEQATIPAE